MTIQGRESGLGSLAEDKQIGGGLPAQAQVRLHSMQQLGCREDQR
jgi:hypothetical protein